MEWEQKDETLIGEKGLTLSGGQKTRLTLARALYADADIYLLDDPFSALDAKVGRRVFEFLMSTVVGRKTIILVTHQMQFVEKCDEVLMLEEGRIARVVSPANMQLDQLSQPLKPPESKEMQSTK